MKVIINWLKSIGWLIYSKIVRKPGYFKYTPEEIDIPSVHLGSADKRKEEIIDLIKSKKKLSIKIINASDYVRHKDESKAWGDYWVKKELEDCFQKSGHHIVKDDNLAETDLLIYLFGYPFDILQNKAFFTKTYNIIWIHSHPDWLKPEHLQNFDQIYVQSPLFDKTIRKWGYDCRLLVGATSKKPINTDLKYDVIFVGNARRHLFHGRKIIKDLGNLPYNIRIWGKFWEGKIPDRYYAGQYYPNEELGQLYASAKIVINDHQDDMSRQGFISFRIFDALAAGSFVISDKNKGVDRIFGDSVPQYQDSNDFKNMITRFIENPEDRIPFIKKGQKIALRYSFQQLAENMLALKQKSPSEG